MLSGSVGKGGKNNSDDVKKVKQQLRNVGYPIKALDDIVDEYTIIAIKLFQLAYQEIKKG